MLKWIKMLNKLYENHPCTSSGEVVIEYCPKMDVVVVKVHSNYKVVELGDFNDWGVLTKIQEVVNEMY